MKIFGHNSPSDGGNKTIFLERARYIADNNSHDAKRINNALLVETEEQEYYPEKLTRQNLQQMAKYVNNTYIHYSGNCVLLAACLHYNLHYRKDILSAKNTASPTIGISGTIVDQLIFGKQLESSHRFHCLADLEKELLMRYMINGERSFIIQAQGYTVPIIGQCGHDFNAVVLCGEDNKPYVQFVDSWKTFNVLPTITELNAHFPIISRILYSILSAE